jgi:hypothetical protein
MPYKRYIDFFDEETRESLLQLQKQLFLNDKDYFEKNIKSKIDVDFYNFLIVDRAAGRASVTMPAHLFPENVVSFVNDAASKINKNATLKFATFVTYSKKYGDPQLVPHFDKPSKAPFIIDYQLFSNKVWPLVVDGVDEIMWDNEALFLPATTVMHWRKPDVFTEDQEVSVIFFSFYDPEFSADGIYFDKEKMDKAYATYEKQAELVYNDTMKLNYKKLLGMW